MKVTFGEREDQESLIILPFVYRDGFLCKSFKASDVVAIEAGDKHDTMYVHLNGTLSVDSATRRCIECPVPFGEMCQAFETLKSKRGVVVDLREWDPRFAKKTANMAEPEEAVKGRPSIKLSELVAFIPTMKSIVEMHDIVEHVRPNKNGVPNFTTNIHFVESYRLQLNGVRYPKELRQQLTSVIYDVLKSELRARIAKLPFDVIDDTEELVANLDDEET